MADSKEKLFSDFPAVSWVKKKGISLKWKQENGLALTKDDKLRMRISFTAGVRAWVLRSVPERRRIRTISTNLCIACCCPM